MIKILLTSVGNKIPLIDAIKGLVSNIYIVGCDINNEVISKRFLDDFFLINPYSQLDISLLLKELEFRKITHIIPTSDLDIEYFSKHKDILLQAGISIMVSDYEEINVINDKLVFYNKLKVDIPVISTEAFYTPHLYEKWVVKSRMGSGSKLCRVNLSEKEVLQISSNIDDNLIYQPYIIGTEYSADIYITPNNEIVGIVTRTRENIRNGESQKTTIVKHTEIENLCVDLLKQLKLQGHVMFQFIEDHYGKIYVIECNARIGGASTASMYAGLNSIYWFINNTSYEEAFKMFSNNKRYLTQYRYSKDLII